MVFMAHLHLLLGVQGEGFLRRLTKFVSFQVPDYSTRRVNRVSIKEDTLLKYKEKDVVMSLDSTLRLAIERGEWMRQKWKVKRGWIKVLRLITTNRSLV